MQCPSRAVLCCVFRAVTCSCAAAGCCGVLLYCGVLLWRVCCTEAVALSLPGVLLVAVAFSPCVSCCRHSLLPCRRAALLPYRTGFLFLGEKTVSGPSGAVSKGAAWRPRGPGFESKHRQKKTPINSFYTFQKYTSDITCAYSPYALLYPSVLNKLSLFPCVSSSTVKEGG